MSLFNKGGSSKSAQTSTNSNESTNANLQDTGDGTNVALGKVEGSVNITAVDPGAISLAMSTVQTAADQFFRAADFAERNSKMSYDAVSRAFDRSTDLVNETNRLSLDTISDTERRAFDYASDAYSRAGEFVGSAFDRSTGLVSDAFARAVDAIDQTRKDNNATVTGTLTTIEDIARQQATSGDQRVQQISQTAIYAVIAVVSIIGLAIVFRGS